MIRYSVLGSGSSGNSYIINYKDTSILLDAGFSLRQIKDRVAMSDIDFSTIKALFITHLHPDHARGAGVFARQTAMPVYLHHCINENIKEFASLRIPHNLTQFFQVGEPVSVGPFNVTSFQTHHDSPYSVGFFIEIKNKKFLLLTDTGQIEDEMVEYAHKSDILFLEANYDEAMLMNGPYPYQLKKRISGPYGHLSNANAITLLNKIHSNSFQKVYFCHLSNTNNRVDLLNQLIQKELLWSGESTVCHHGDLYSSYLKLEEG